MANKHYGRAWRVAAAVSASVLALQAAQAAERPAAAIPFKRTVPLDEIIAEALGRGRGRSKKEAEQEAAREALEGLESRHGL